jgi:hypothetical protein
MVPDKAEEIVWKLKVALPFVVRTCPAVPSAVGSVKAVLEEVLAIVGAIISGAVMALPAVIVPEAAKLVTLGVPVKLKLPETSD